MMTLDRKYRDELILALRLRDISGARVGEVIAEVEAHVAETGEDPVQAFGPPKEYAAKVAAELDTSTGKPSKLRTVVGTLIVGGLTYVGVTMLVSGLTIDQDRVPLTASDIVAAAVCVCLLIPAVGFALRAVATEPRGKVYRVLAVLAAIGAFLGMPLTKLLVDDETPVLEMPSPVALGIGAAALLGAVLMLWQAIRHGRIVDPRTSRTR